jgi:hypothetical protein
VEIGSLVFVVGDKIHGVTYQKHNTFQSNQVKEDEMGRASSTNGGEERCI